MDSDVAAAAIDCGGGAKVTAYNQSGCWYHVAEVWMLAAMQPRLNIMAFVGGGRERMSTTR